MRFSERIGKKNPKWNLQINSMDGDLRNGLWNVIYEHIVNKMRDPAIPKFWRDFFTKVYDKFFKQPTDQIPWASSDQVRAQVKGWFFKAEWYEVYDFLEFALEAGATLDRKYGPTGICLAPSARYEVYEFNTEFFRQDCNSVLEAELSAYRFVGDVIAPITDKVQIAEVEQALGAAEKHSLIGVTKHIESALEKLSDRKSPDYRNSIKESISAVESLSVIIAKDSKATLGQALKKIKHTISLHPALEKGFSAIYGYTSDEGGIRHAMVDETTCDFEDAKYMLVSCSAFVNYLIMKASKTGLIE